MRKFVILAVAAMALFAFSGMAYAQGDTVTITHTYAKPCSDGYAGTVADAISNPVTNGSTHCRNEWDIRCSGRWFAG